jgi:hypothetical protein
MGVIELIITITLIFVLLAIAKRVFGGEWSRGSGAAWLAAMALFVAAVAASAVFSYRCAREPRTHSRGRPTALETDQDSLDFLGRPAALETDQDFLETPVETKAVRHPARQGRTRLAARAAEHTARPAPAAHEEKADDGDEPADGRPAPKAELAGDLDLALLGSPAQDVVIPLGRPEWVEAEPVLVGEVATWPVASGVHVLKQDCRRALDEALQSATAEYVDWLLGRERASAWVDFTAQYIRTRLVRPENVYHEVIQTSVGPVHQTHALLEFGEAFRHELDELRATSRLLQVGLAAALVLGVVAALYSYFRLDTATRGYYTRRLQFAAAGAILGWVAAGLLLAWKIPWI